MRHLYIKKLKERNREIIDKQFVITNRDEH